MICFCSGKCWVPLDTYTTAQVIPPMPNCTITDPDMYTHLDHWLRCIESGNFDPVDFCKVKLIKALHRGEELFMKFPIGQADHICNMGSIREASAYPAHPETLPLGAGDWAAIGHSNLYKRVDIVQNVGVYVAVTARNTVPELPDAWTQLLVGTGDGFPNLGNHVRPYGALHIQYPAGRAVILRPGSMIPRTVSKVGRQGKGWYLVLSVCVEQVGREKTACPALVVLCVQDLHTLLNGWKKRANKEKIAFLKKKSRIQVISIPPKWSQVNNLAEVVDPKSLDIVADFFMLRLLAGVPRLTTLTTPKVMKTSREA